MTPALAAELVGRSQATLRELNIDEYTAALGTALQLHPSSSSSLLEFPQLRQLAISSSDTDYTQPMIDGARLPALEMLYFRETTYPPAYGNRVFASAAVRLMPGVWRRLRLLVVDALSSGDIAVIGAQAPSLKVLRVGLLGCDVDVPEPITVPPVPAMDIPAVLAVLQSCTQLVDFSVETPDAFEDAYNNHDHADPLIPWFERPSSSSANTTFAAVDLASNAGGLKTLMLNAWALTFDQLLALFHALPALTSFEGSLKFNASYACRRRCSPLLHHTALAHQSLVLSAPARHRRVFTSSLLRFVAMLPALRTLELYGSVDMPGVAAAVARVVPGCVAGFYAISRSD
ncbi:hypothetical protein GGF38_002442 [Coemansia sp. RSA 25]|nr:hypothetical protein GGF38_002442 [Coemansia sp. RSA 25]